MNVRSILLSTILGVGMVVALPGAANASTSDTYESSVITYTNKHRVNHHLVKLKAQSCVDRYAESHARWMARNRTLKHQSMSRILNECNLRRVGENIASGFSSGPKTVSAWMRSPGHRANILKSSYRIIGVGAVQDSRGRWWVSQVFGTKR